MRTLTKTALIISALALAACGNSRFDSNGGAGGVGADGAGLGGIGTSNLDPASPAFFNQSIGNTVLFAVDQSTLSEQARSVLSQQSRWMLENNTYSAIIEGHADEQGTREYNLALGARRAAAARDFLVSQGVADNRLRTVTFGKERPLEACSTEACYSQNRRSVSVVSAGVGS